MGQCQRFTVLGRSRGTQSREGLCTQGGVGVDVHRRGVGRDTQKGVNGGYT